MVPSEQAPIPRFPSTQSSRMDRLLSSVAVVAFVFSPACQLETPSRSSPDSGGEETGTEADVTERDADSGGPDIVRDVSFCSVDFPCRVSAACDPDDPSVRWELETIPCEQVCDTSQCSGATCRRDDESCASGEVCVGSGTEAGEVEASCTAESETCGGPDGRTCDDGEFCEYGGALAEQSGLVAGPGGDAIACEPDRDIYGRCVEIPEDCESAEGRPVCGCDGTTYANDCERKKAGVGLAHEGECSG